MEKFVAILFCYYSKANDSLIMQYYSLVKKENTVLTNTDSPRKEFSGKNYSGPNKHYEEGTISLLTLEHLTSFRNL